MESMIAGFDRKVSVVSEFMTKQGFEMLVVGSGALLICGLPLRRAPKDVDVEVICTNKQERILKALADSYGNNFYQIKEQYPEVTGFEHKPYIFRIGEVEVNVWAVREFTHHHTVKYNGVRYATAMSVLQKKMMYHRPKDLADLNNIIIRLLSVGNENVGYE